MHNKLLAVLLGVCLSNALRFVEEVKRRHRTTNVPLFDQLLENLCEGDYMDWCYEALLRDHAEHTVGNVPCTGDVMLS